MNTSSTPDAVYFIVLFSMCVAGVLLAFPYVKYMGMGMFVACAGYWAYELRKEYVLNSKPPAKPEAKPEDK
jgi:hypothetical protein